MWRVRSTLIWVPRRHVKIEVATIIGFSLAMLTIIEAYPFVSRHSLQRNTSETFCSNLLSVNNLHYSLHDQIKISGIPADFSIHWNTGDVYFTVITEEMKMSIVVLRRNGLYKTVQVAGLGQSTTVDNLNDIVYLATDNGVYKYTEDGSTLYTASGKDVMYVALSDNSRTMYIATWPQNRVHKITNGGQNEEPFPLIPNGHGLAIDTRNNIYFVASKTTYILKNGQSIAIKIKSLPSDMTGVFVSKSSDIYAMDKDSNLYSIDPEIATAKHLGSFHVSGVNAFAMDSDNNVIIGVQGAIFKFKAYINKPASCEAVRKGSVLI